MSRPVLLIEIGAGPLPTVTAVTRPAGNWVPVVYQAPTIEAPTEVNPTPVTDGILLQWNPVAGVGVVYIIDRGATADGPWVEIARTPATRYLYSDGTDAVWYFRIRASINGRIGGGNVVRAQLDMTTEKIRQEFLARVKADQEFAKDLIQQARDLANLQALVEAPEWIDQDWPAGSIVKHDGGLYVAKQDVPQGTTIDDAGYWSYIGQYTSLAEAVGAIGVSTNEITTLVEQLDEELRVLANDVSGLQSSLSGKADASAVQAMSTRLTQAENSLTSLSQQISTVRSLIAGKADSTALQALQTQVTQVGNEVTSLSSALTSVRSQSGGGANLLYNASPDSSLDGWSIVGDAWGATSLTRGIATISDGWQPIGMAYFQLYKDRAATGNVFVQSSNIPVTPGKRYGASCWIASHTAAQASVRLVWANRAGQEVGTAPIHWVSISGGTTLNDYIRAFASGAAPSDAAFARVQLISQGSASAPYLYSWFIRPMLEELGVNQTVPSTWQPSSAGLDAKYAQATQSLSTRLTRTENGVNSYEASSTLALDVNGRVVGTRSVNNGVTGTIDFVFDKVRFLSPDSGGARAEMINGNYFVYAPNGVRVIAQGWSI
ncbi:hypothetical protein AB3094_14925 [Xanthomonas euvesicatoria]|uniref:hypothetical protein n=1 Tax=Xanthomonas TaxID=338 RepID=UPI00321B62E5